MSLRTSYTRVQGIVRACSRGHFLLKTQTAMSSVDPPSYALNTSTRKANKEPSDMTTDISSNPFFEKYKAKIQHMQSSNPEEYEERLRELSERLNPKFSPSASKSTGTNTLGANHETGTQAKSSHTVVPPSEAAQAGMTRSKGLDSVMKLDLIKDKTSEEISQLWNQYHSKKDCVFAVLKADEFMNLMDKSKESPVFVYPIPRDDGFEFILSQFDRYDVYFTPLGIFQMVRENAPPCLTLTHYTELLEDKGIVLMSGQFDEKVLNHNLALNLVQQMSMFYGKESRFYELVHRFNYQPESFKYQDLIDVLKTLPQYDLK